MQVCNRNLVDYCYLDKRRTRRAPLLPMNYQTFHPHADLAPLIKCYWTLEIPAEANPQRQRIIPDGCIEMIFILGDDVKRYTSDDNFILQPRAMILGQTIDPFYVEPTGYVHSFAARFYPYGFAAFATTAINNLVNKETPIHLIFGEKASRELEEKIVNAPDTQSRIKITEEFLSSKLENKSTIDSIVKATIDTLLKTNGSTHIKSILNDGGLSKRRQLERKFLKEVGLSPKQLGKVIRLQAALKMLLNQSSESMTAIAYESDYYDQAHFIKDFKKFTGTNPKAFLGDNQLALSSLFYTGD